MTLHHEEAIMTVGKPGVPAHSCSSSPADMTIGSTLQQGAYIRSSMRVEARLIDIDSECFWGVDGESDTERNESQTQQPSSVPENSDATMLRSALQLFEGKLRLKRFALALATPDAEDEGHPEGGIEAASIYQEIFDDVNLQQNHPFLSVGHRPLLQQLFFRRVSESFW